MNRSARLRVALVIALIAIVIGAVLLPGLLEWRNARAFNRIAMGDQETRVILYLGYPDAKGSCGTPLRWDRDSLGANDGRCVREVRYQGRHGVWVVGYSADAHVVSKYYQTPDQLPAEAPSAR